MSRKSYLTGAVANPRHTHQSRPIPGSSQVQNSAGGYTWDIGPFERLTRWLILGSEGGSFYASEHKLTTDNAAALLECIKANGHRTVELIVEISDAGRARKNDQAIYALAVATVPEYADERTRQRAFAAIPKVCRTATHLFMFCEFVNGMRGWGEGLRKAVGAWYTREDVGKVTYQAVKYQQREGWSHRDVLRVIHPEAPTPSHSALFAAITGNATRKWGENHDDDELIDPMVVGLRRSMKAESAEEAARLVKAYGLPHEALLTQFKNQIEVQDALLESGMPMGALIRNLASYTRSGLLTTTSNATRKVIDQIGNGEHIKKARVHPVAILQALFTYASGRSLRGDSTWVPVPAIIDALDEAFYLAFANAEPTGKRRLIALDISGSMGYGIQQSIDQARRGYLHAGYGHKGWVANVPGFSPRVAAAAMCLVTLHSGDPVDVVGFSTGLTPIGLSKRQRIDDVVNQVSRLPHGGTDCSLPMLWAESNARSYDVFEIYTDNETWAGHMHPAQALAQYRRHTVPDAKAAVIAFAGNEFSIADPNDPRMMDFVGFDASAPAIMSSFIRGEL